MFTVLKSVALVLLVLLTIGGVIEYPENRARISRHLW